MIQLFGLYILTQKEVHNLEQRLEYLADIEHQVKQDEKRQVHDFASSPDVERISFRSL